MMMNSESRKRLAADDPEGSSVLGVSGVETSMPEPTDQTREQIAAVLAEHQFAADVGNPRGCACGWEDGYSPKVYDLHRAHLADVLASRLAVHVSPETAEEREGCSICGQCHVDHEGDRLLIEWQKGEIARLETEAEQMRDEAAAVARAGGR